MNRIGTCRYCGGTGTTTISTFDVHIFYNGTLCEGTGKGEIIPTLTYVRGDKGEWPTFDHPGTPSYPPSVWADDVKICDVCPWQPEGDDQAETLAKLFASADKMYLFIQSLAATIPSAADLIAKIDNDEGDGLQ